MRALRICLFACVCLMLAGLSALAQPLAGTQPLELTGDLADQMVSGIDRFLLRKTEESIEKRGRHWHRDLSSAEAYDKSVAPNRARLAKIIGAHDPREAVNDLDFVAAAGRGGVRAVHGSGGSLAGRAWSAGRGAAAVPGIS
jgi:hypothetical protein